MESRLGLGGTSGAGVCALRAIDGGAGVEYLGMGGTEDPGAGV